MRTVDSTYKTGAKQKIRDVAVKIETNAAEAKTITADKIISATIQRSLTDGSFTIGNTPSDRLNAVVIDTDKLPKKTRVTISAAFDSSAYERIGRFYVDKCTRNGQHVTITAFDALSLTETEVKFGGKAEKDLQKLNFPCTMQQMLDYIVTLKGMTCEFECQPFTVAKKPMKSETEYYTARELFGFIAGCHACNAKMDYDGKLTFREFGKVAAELTADNVLDMSVDDFEPFTVKGVLFSVGDDSIYIDDTPGSEYDAEADGIVQTNNPLATVEVAEYVWNKIGNLSYYGGSIKIRGEGILEPGDVVTVKNLKYLTDTTEYPVLITDISYSITRDGGFIETLSSAVSKKSSSNVGGATGTSAGCTAGAGIKKEGKEISLKKAGYGDANIGGICINGWGLYYPRDKYEVDSGYLSTLALKYAGFTGTGYRNFIGGICLGEGLENIKAENGIDYQRTAVAIGQGLEFVDVPSDEGSQSSYHKRVSVKLGDGLDFDANNALIASMKPATSSAIGGVKAGTNITIAEDGTISTPSYVGTDGVQITSGGTSRTVRLLTGNGLTFVDGKLTAFLGKNLKFSAGGEIESEFAVKNGIVFTNDESYKFIHNISEVLYQDSDYEVMTGAQDSFILNKELVYGEGKNAPNGVEVNSTGADSPSGIPDIPVKKDRFYIFDKACYYKATSYEEITAIDLVHISSSASMNYDRYATRITYADGTTLNVNSFDNYDKYSGYGMALLWTDIYPPGSTFNQTTFENGCVRAQPAYRYKGGGTDPYRFSKHGNPLIIGFASKEEYYAAMGLVYGTIDLADLVDDPESSGGGGSIDTGDKYKSPTVSLQRTTVSGRGAVKITVVDVLGTHTSYVYDGDVVKFTSQLTNDSGFVARKSGVPYNVIAIPGANSAVLVWEKVTGASQYRVQRLNNGTWGTIAYPTANSYRATGLTAGTEYAYRVLASMDGTTWGSASEAAYVTPFSAVSAASISGISETPSDEFEGEEVTTI